MCNALKYPLTHKFLIFMHYTVKNNISNIVHKTDYWSVIQENTVVLFQNFMFHSIHYFYFLKLHCLLKCITVSLLLFVKFTSNFCMGFLSVCSLKF